MKIEKPARAFEMVLSISFDASDGIVKIDNRALPPVNYGTALAIKLSPEEAGKMGRAMLDYSEAGRT